MPTLLEYFNNDFLGSFSLDKKLTVTSQNVDDNQIIDGEKEFEIIERIRIYMDSSARLFTYYIPKVSDTLNVIGSLINQLEIQVKEAEGFIGIAGFGGDVKVGEHKNVYSNRIYSYTENLLTSEGISILDKFCKANSLFVTVRSTDYIKRKMEVEIPFAFISHDSRDKELIAKKLANGLHSRLCYVWYDEYSLKIGDSLRESIEDGIKKAKKCIIVLTKTIYKIQDGGKRNLILYLRGR